MIFIHTSEADNVLDNRNQESLNSFAHWIQLFGYEISQTDIHLDENLDKAGHAWRVFPTGGTSTRGTSRQ